ncbi:MAG: hypothetical protein D6734_09970 [Candidatus Schekmanbacteria bacterium]|nr:MAG: hypothetical protein D6734_09970 [Candidatus Schekmanbacteria bacterium]
MKRYFLLLFCTVLFFVSSPCLSSAGQQKEIEALKKQMEALKKEYETKFQILLEKIEQLKAQQEAKEKQNNERIRKEVEKVKAVAAEKDEERKKEIIELKSALEEQKKRSILAGFDGKHFTLGSEDGNFKLNIGGYMQTDYRYYEGGEDENNKNTFDIRRARLTASGNMFKNIKYKLQTDFSDEDDELRDAYVDIDYTPLAIVRAGQFKVPFGYEQTTSSTTFDFIERSVAGNFIASTSRDIGVMLFGSLFENRMKYYLGAFNGTGENSTDDNDSLTFIGRLLFSPFTNDKDSLLKGLTFGGSFSGGDREAHSSRAITLAARNKISNTVTVNGQRTRAAAEARYFKGPFSLKGEYYYQREERNDISGRDFEDLITQGFYGIATYVLTGEEKIDGKNIVPTHNFNPKTGDWGAFELAARYSYFDLDKANGSDPVIENENVSANTIQGFTFGLNWYFNKYLKLMADYSFYDFDQQENLSHPSIGDSTNQFTARLQVKF